MKKTQDRHSDLEYRLEIARNIFQTPPYIDYEFFKTDDLLILTSAKIGTSFIKTYLKSNNIKFIEGSFKYLIDENFWSEDTSTNEPIGINNIMSNPDIRKLILFRNPRIKVLSGVLQDFNGAMITLGNSIIGRRLFQDKYEIPEEMFAMMDGYRDFDLEVLMNTHPDIMERIFVDFFMLGIKDNNLLYQHSKLVSKNIYWLLESGKIKLGENDSVIDIDTHGQDVITVLKDAYQDKVQVPHDDSYYNSNISEYFIYESPLWNELAMRDTPWFRTMENRINTDWLFYDLMKQKWQRTIIKK
jgi:hypothetical protein